MLQIQPGDLPVLAVHILREKRQPDGQQNQTVPRFINDLTSGLLARSMPRLRKQDDLQISEEMMSEPDDILSGNALPGQDDGRRHRHGSRGAVQQGS